MEKLFSYRKHIVFVLGHFFPRMVLLLVFILLTRIYELSTGQISQLLLDKGAFYIGLAFLSDLTFTVYLTAWLLILYFLIYILSYEWANVFVSVVCVVVALVHIILISYFSIALNPLGSDLYEYSIDELILTIGAGVTADVVGILIFLLTVVVLVFRFVPRQIHFPKILLYGCLLVTFFCFFFVGPELKFGRQVAASEFINNALKNKSAYFYKSSWHYFTGIKEKLPLDLYADNYLGQVKYRKKELINQFTYVDPICFPFLHSDNSSDVLSSHWVKNERPPDIVIIILEGLGRAFSNSNAYLGSFTPFLDSLSTKSLYWENCLSTGGRTFAVMPSLLGSLPFGKHGFAEMGNRMPKHLSLIKILKSNGYHTRFFYAGDSHFDNMDVFMQNQGIDEIIDKMDFDGSYDPLPSNKSGFSWGYGDVELYRRYFKSFDERHVMPSVNVILTVSTHSPFLLNDQVHYDVAFQKRLNVLKQNTETKKICQESHRQLASVLCMDDAMKFFFDEYRKRKSFRNTIFIITGDHRMPDIPIATKVDRYHIPLIIYSPQLTRPAKYSAVVSHFDVTPSLIAFGKYSCQLTTPSLVCWIGAGLDSTVHFTNRNAYPLMQTKNNVNEFVSGTIFFSNSDFFNLGTGMTLMDYTGNTQEQNRLNMMFSDFKDRNEMILNMKSLYPDSLLEKYSCNRN